MPTGYEQEQEETLNFQVVTMDEFTDFVRDAIEMENYDTPIICLGKSGIGKTESIDNAIARPLNIGLVQLRLASYSETDLIGVPYFADGKVAGKKYTKFADMNILPHLASTGEGDAPDIGILLLDEITAASKPVRTVALQLLDSSRSIGDYTLPPKWMIVLLGNGPTDGGMYQGLEYALISRAMCLRVRPDFASWKKWALKNNVHPAVIGFIENSGGTNMLHRIKSADLGGYEEKECNPRSWVKLSTFLTKKEQRVGGMLSESQVRIYAGAAVGANLSIEFSTYYSCKSELVSIEDIMSGEALNIKANTLKLETVYMGEPVLVHAMSELLNRNRDRIENDELPGKPDLMKIRNIIRWIIHISKGLKRPNIALETLQDISNTNELFVSLIMVDEFDDMVPEYAEYSNDKADVFGVVRALSNN